MKLYNEKERLYIEMDASGVGLGAGLLLVRMECSFQKNKASDNAALHPIAFTSKSSTSRATRYSKTEREVLGIFNILEQFLHYCFASMVSMITYQKTFVTIIRKDIATLSQRLQRILLHIH